MLRRNVSKSSIRQLKSLRESDEAVGGHEERVQTANPSEPAQQLNEVAESLERQTRWVEQQYAALAADEDLVRAGQVLPEEALPGVREEQELSLARVTVLG